jgi:ribokinase
MCERWDILGLGIVAVDDLLYVAEYPRPDTKVAIQVRQRQGGGLTGTALVAAARLGAKAAYGGILGDDALSRYTIEAFEREGVDCAPVLHHAGARPCHATIVVDQSTGLRTILYSVDGVISRSPEQVSPQLIAACRLLFVDYTSGYGGLRAARLAHAQGIEVVGDVERLTVPGAEELIYEIDHLIVGIDLARLVTDETTPERMVRALAGEERACCAVTVGEHGCWYSERGGEVQHVPAFRVEAVDTTGCGDVFHGAYAACIAKGECVSDAIRVAAAVAALKAMQPGGRNGIPDRPTVDRFLCERGLAGHRNWGMPCDRA